MAKRKPTIAECDAQFIKPGSVFEMAVEEVNGLKFRVFTEGHRTMRPYFLEMMNKWADRVFSNASRDEPYPKDERFDMTYGELHKRSVALAAWLRSRGVGIGTRVGLLGYNSADWVIVFVATALLGAVPVIVNSWVQPDAMVHCLKLASPVLVLADAKSANTLVPHAAELAAGNVGPILAWSTVHHLEHKNISTIDFSKLSPSAEDVLAITSGVGLDVLTPHSPATIFFTSGTTGMPKGVPLTQCGMLHNLKSGQAGAIRTGIRGGAPVDLVMKMVLAGSPEQVKVLHAVPLFHITGCVQMIGAFKDGRKLHFMRKWSVKDAVKLLVDHRIEVVGGVPAISSAILQSPDLPPDFQLKQASYGGAAPPSRLAQDLKERFPDIALGTAWGMTEAAALITSFSGPDYLENPKSCGFPVPSNEVRVASMEDGKTVLGVNEVGVLQVRGYNILQGYLNDSAATAKSMSADGWLDTGDAGYIDEQGLVYVSDRIKDIIIRGGENISSEEVENAVYLDDRIAEAAAVPVPDQRMGELVSVAVSLRPGARATPDEIIDAVAPRLRREARPVFVWVSDGLLPMNANGKFIKTEIKKIVHDLYRQHLSRQSKL